jgi:hypothetical protein
VQIAQQLQEVRAGHQSPTNPSSGRWITGAAILPHVQVVTKVIRLNLYCVSSAESFPLVNWHGRTTGLQIISHQVHNLVYMKRAMATLPKPAKAGAQTET